MGLLLHLNQVNETEWAQRLQAVLGDIPVYLRTDTYNPDEISYIFAWKPDANAFDGLNNLKAIFSLGAGVDALLAHPTVPQVPIVRFVDEDLTQCMSDYVISQVMMHQRLFTRYQAHQEAKIWSQLFPPSSSEISVGIMGLGVLGLDAATKLKNIGFQVNGWSRSHRTLEGINTFSGHENLNAFLNKTDILVCLLPLTPDTRGILNYETFKQLRRGTLIGGPVLVNAARGGHQVETDILRALDDNTLSAASLDVFEVEPLPQSSPIWSHKKVFVTPHIAAISNENSGVKYFSQMLLDHVAGKPLRNTVNRDLGY